MCATSLLLRAVGRVLLLLLLLVLLRRVPRALAGGPSERQHLLGVGREDSEPCRPALFLNNRAPGALPIENTLLGCWHEKFAKRFLLLVSSLIMLKKNACPYFAFGDV